MKEMILLDLVNWLLRQLVSKHELHDYTYTGSYDHAREGLSSHGQQVRLPIHK